MRQGELLALCWEDIDLVGQRIHIKKSLIYLNKQYKRVNPKTDKPRIIPISKSLVDILNHHKTKQQEHQRSMGTAYDKADNFVFANQFGKAIHPRSLTGHYKRMIVQANVPYINFHSLRHTHASHMLKLGNSIVDVSRRLGHSKVSMTLDVYSHITNGSHEEAIAKFENFLTQDTCMNENLKDVDNSGGHVKEDKEVYYVA